MGREVHDEGEELLEVRVRVGGELVEQVGDDLVLVDLVVEVGDDVEVAEEGRGDEGQQGLVVGGGGRRGGGGRGGGLGC